MIALFPGRFDPVHLGHILTIMRLYDKFDKIIVAITEDDYSGTKSRITSIEEREKTLKDVFKYLPKVEVVYVGIGLRIRETWDDLPKFDVVITGNPEVFEHCAKAKIPVKFCERSQGLGYSGTELRWLIK